MKWIPITRGPAKMRFLYTWMGQMLLLAVMSAGMMPHRASAQVITVSPRGSVRSLQQALDAASPGQRIVVEAGVYREHAIVIDKSVQVVGVGAPMLDGDGEPIVTITADSVVLEGLVFRNVATSFVDDRAAVKVDGAHHCRIADNRFDDAFFAIYLAKSAGCEIRDNTIVGKKSTESRSGNGIHLWYSRQATITGNTIRGHRDGIYLEFVEDSEVMGNVSEFNLRYGLHFMFSDRCAYRDNVLRENDAGVAVMYTKNVEMIGNRFVGNWGASSYGLLLKDITDSQIRDNVFRYNTIGIYAEGSDRMAVTGNDFIDNGWALKIMANSIDNTFTRNNFVANTFDIATNSRQSYSRFTGNYWDKYRGYDLDRDGVGDVPFRPVTLFSLLVEQNEPAIILLNSFFIDLMDAAERMLPALTPDALVDDQPAMEELS